MTTPVWSHVLALSAWTLNKALIVSQLPGNLRPDYKYLHARQITHKSKVVLQPGQTWNSNCPHLFKYRLCKYGTPCL